MKSARRRFSISVLAATTFLGACTDEVSIADLNSVERLVVVGILPAAQSGVSVRVSRTLPFSDSYTVGSDAVIDARVTITSGIDVFQGLHDSVGFYKFPGLIPRSGARYELRIEWQGGLSVAQTTVPFLPMAGEVTVQADPTTSEGQIIRATITPKESECYGLTWGMRGGGGISSMNNIRSLRRGSEKTTGENLLLQEEIQIPSSALDSLAAVIFAYDTPLYDYFISRGASRPGMDDRIFPNLGGPATWNVTGSGIGIFVGVATLVVTPERL